MDVSYIGSYHTAEYKKIGGTKLIRQNEAIGSGCHKDQRHT